MKEKRYAGIGSRKAPNNVLRAFRLISAELAKNNYTLYSGHADGSDKEFEAGCELNGGRKKIFIPWYKFNGSDSTYIFKENSTIGIMAMELARKFHPKFDKCDLSVQKLLARDGFQVLDETLDNPVDLVICYTPGGNKKGGTGQAIRIAEAYSIPIIDAGNFTCILDFIRAVERFTGCEFDFMGRVEDEFLESEIM